MSFSISKYFMNQTIDDLAFQAEKIGAIYENSYNPYNDRLSAFGMNKLTNEINILHDYINASFIFIDSNFIIDMCSEDLQKFYGMDLSLEELEPLEYGQTVVLKGQLNGIFEEEVVTLAYPIFVGNDFIGAVLLSTPISLIQQSILGLAMIMLLVCIISLLIATLLIYISSLKMTTNLKTINNAAKVIANGDLEKRIVVVGQDEVAQLSESFNNMADNLDFQNKSRIEFISNISHDIRTPLTSIKGFLEAILDGTIPEEKTPHYLNIVMEETMRLTKMANDLLDLNKIQTLEIKVVKAKFDINELIRYTVLVFEKKLKSKHIDIIVVFNEEKNIVNSDQDKIQRVIYNLIENSIKFTPEYGTISITTIDEKGKLFVKIRDNGCGINKDSQKNVFDRFYKEDKSRGINKEGCGLGLSIVKAFIDAHDEEVFLNKEIESGCEFIFSQSYE